MFACGIEIKDIILGILSKYMSVRKLYGNKKPL